MAELFDEWSEKYEQWFQTPIGRLIMGYEQELILEMLEPDHGETILDAGCGTGIFVNDLIGAGAQVVGLELSPAMLRRSQVKFSGQAFFAVQGDMLRLPFADNTFHKTASNTAIEFIEDARSAIEELLRVTRPGGVIVVTTLNSLSPWADRRQKAAQKGHPLFGQAIFRSPEELLDLAPVKGIFKTAVHFEKEADLDAAQQIEEAGQKRDLDTGAFLAVRWEKPDHWKG
jgi:ubiquinone/menaquinone biosynthesis C-methylase UbiE